MFICFVVLVEQKVGFEVLTRVGAVRIVRLSAADADKNEAKRMSLAEWV